MEGVLNLHELLKERLVFEDGVPNEGLTPGISRREVKVELTIMKTGKAIGTTGVPVEAWKCFGYEGVDMLSDLMQKIYEQDRLPEEWRERVIIHPYTKRRYS